MYVSHSSHSSETLWEPKLHTICPLLKMAIFTVLTMAYYLTFSQGAGFKAAREQAKCRKDSAGLGPSTAILFVSCRTRRKYSESLGRRSCSSSSLSNYFPLISGNLVYCNFVYAHRHTGRRLKGLTFQTSFELVFKLFGDREECHLEKIYCISPKSPSASTKVT